MNPYNLHHSFYPLGDTIALAIYLFNYGFFRCFHHSTPGVWGEWPFGILNVIKKYSLVPFAAVVATTANFLLSKKRLSKVTVVMPVTFEKKREYVSNVSCTFSFVGYVQLRPSETVDGKVVLLVLL